jgi:hypothetical protein
VLAASDQGDGDRREDDGSGLPDPDGIFTAIAALT